MLYIVIKKRLVNFFLCVHKWTFFPHLLRLVYVLAIPLTRDHFPNCSAPFTIVTNVVRKRNPLNQTNYVRTAHKSHASPPRVYSSSCVLWCVFFSAALLCFLYWINRFPSRNWQLFESLCCSRATGTVTTRNDVIGTFQYLPTISIFDKLWRIERHRNR